MVATNLLLLPLWEGDGGRGAFTDGPLLYAPIPPPLVRLAAQAHTARGSAVP